MVGSGLLDVFIFLAAACAVVPFVSRFNLGSVLGYVIAGVVIGPYVFGFITEAEKIMHFAEFGVIMMLFVIGLELEPAALWRLRKSILGLGGLQLLLTSAVFCAAGILLGLEWQTSLTVGMALSLSSTALVLQMLKERNLMSTAIGETSFSILLFQDIAVIAILIAMPLLAMKGVNTDTNHSSVISDLPGYLQALVVAATITVMVVGGRYALPYLFRAIAKTDLREIFTALSLALIVGITLLMQMLGISPALGAFIAGVVLANSQYRRTLETDIEPFKGLLLGLFFISVGMGINFDLLAAKPVAIVSIIAVLMLAKAGILWVLGRSFGLTPIYAVGCALLLSQGGEFAFVLFQFADRLSILTTEQSQFLTLAVAMSIAATPLVMVWYNRVIVPKFMSVLPPRDYDVVESDYPIIMAGFGRFGQVIGRFLTGQGMKVTVLEKDPDQIELLRKFGFKGYFGDSTRLDLLKSAGAANAKLLIIAVDDVESSLKIARMAREEFPSLTIFARARNRKHAYTLHTLGVHYFKREMFDSSLMMARDIMVWMGKSEEEMNAKAKQFRRHDEETLKSSFEFFEDESALVKFAKLRSAELEQILQRDSIQQKQ